MIMWELNGVDRMGEYIVDKKFISNISLWYATLVEISPVDKNGETY